MNEQVKSPVQILTVTRDVFKATHWIAGAYTSELWVEEPIVLDEGDSTHYKVVGCAVGGLRYAALAPMDNALDEAWLVANFQEMGEGSFQNKTVEPAAVESYMHAIIALAKEVQGEDSVQEYLADTDDDRPDRLYAQMQYIEDVIVGWNDSFEYDSDDAPEEQEEARKRIVAEEILPMFDRAINRLVMEGAAA